MKPNKPTFKKRSQLDKFKDAARLTGSTNTEVAFDEALKRIAKAPASKPVKKARKRAK